MITTSELMRIGPFDRLPDIADLADALDSYADLYITSRLYRAGLYHVEGQCRDVMQLKAWLEQRRDVRAVSATGSMLHVIPATEEA